MLSNCISCLTFNFRLRIQQTKFLIPPDASRRRMLSHGDLDGGIVACYNHFSNLTSSLSAGVLSPGVYFKFLFCFIFEMIEYLHGISNRLTGRPNKTSTIIKLCDSSDMAGGWGNIFCNNYQSHEGYSYHLRSSL